MESLPKTKTKIVKDYATTSSGKWCNFRYDYSFFSFSKCNNCVFCYSKVPGTNLRRRFAAITWKKEVHFNEYLFKMPITVSRFCDPLLNSGVTKQSIMFTKYILENGGMISFVSPSLSVPEELFEVANTYKDRFQYQVRVFSDTSTSGKLVRNLFAPKFPDIELHKDNIERLLFIGTKVIIKIDPIIIGINDVQVQSIISYFNSIGCHNFILRQVYASPLLKEEVSLVSRRSALLLSEPVSKYYTYTGEVWFDFASKIILDNPESTFTFCQNSWMNKLIKSHKNCCQFDSAEYVFNENYSNVDQTNNANNGERIIKV